MAFTLADLNIPQTELDQIQAALVSLRSPGAISSAMTEAEQRVTDYVQAYSVPENSQKRLWRQLVLWDLYAMTGMTSDVRRKAYEDALQELRDIRDGKMPYAAATTPPESVSGGGAWGSSTNILL